MLGALLDLNQLSGNTRRLEVSTLKFSDLEEARLLHNQYSVLSQLSDSRPVSLLQQREWFNKLSESISSTRLVLRNIESGVLVGVFRVDRIDIVNKSVMIGLDVHEKHRRQGYARETYLFILEKIFEVWVFNRAYLETLKTNTAAISLYRSLGMHYEGTGRQAVRRGTSFADLEFYGILRSEWKDNVGRR